MTSPAAQPPVKEPVAPKPDVVRGRRAVWALTRDLFAAFRRQPVSMLAKQAAYSLLYGVPSILIVLVSLTALIDKETNARTSEILLDAIDERAPAELQPLLRSLVDHAIVETSQGTATLTALVSFGVAIWSGSGGVGALIYACNLVYDVRDTRSWLVRNVLKLALLLIGGVLVVVAILLFAFGQRVGEWLADELNQDGALVNVLVSGRGWAAALVFCALVLLYVAAPDVEQSIRWILPGALVATLAVIVTFAGLDLVFGIVDPGSAYGAVGGVLLLLWTLWVLSAIVVGGAVINAVVARRFDRRLAAHLEAHPDKRLGPRASAD